MHLVYNPYMLLPLFAMLMAVFLWIRGWRYHSSRMGKTYLVLMGVLAWWSLAVVMEHWNQGLAPKIFWIKMSYFGIVCLPVAWLIFTAQYTGREKMVDGPQCFSAVYRSSDYPDYGLDQQHVSPDVERHLAGYQY